MMPRGYGAFAQGTAVTLGALSRWPIFVPAVMLCTIFVLPAASVDIPAMVDCPNHLSRMHLLADGASHTSFYELDWRFYPNLAMDLLVPSLGRLIGVEPATKLFYVASLLLIATGAMAIEHVVKGER
jgi:hypothetical protein